MTYSFDVDVAQEYGVNGAVMIKNFQFWIMKHRAEEKNFFDGRYWTYNSVRGWSELFCFWTPKQIRTILDNLVERGVLKKGNYNQTPYDRTSWYAFVDEEKWIGSKGQIDLPKRSNEIVQMGQPIPDNNTDNNTDNEENNIFTSKNIQKKNDYLLLGEFKNVKLTVEQVKKLIEKYGWYLGSALEELSGYMATKKTKYESHYAVLRENGWVWNKVHENIENGAPESCEVLEDPTQPGGLRRISALEYYGKKYGLDTGQPKIL